MSHDMVFAIPFYMTNQRYASVIACASYEFECATSGTCISQDWVCDGVTDCQGEGLPGSDEQDCGEHIFARNLIKLRGISL